MKRVDTSFTITLKSAHSLNGVTITLSSWLNEVSTYELLQLHAKVNSVYSLHVLQLH